MDAQNKTRPFGMRDYFGYAMGDFGCNMSFALITNYLMLFYTQYVGLELKRLGLDNHSRKSMGRYK